MVAPFVSLMNLVNFQETLDGLIYEFTKCDTRSFS